MDKDEVAHAHQFLDTMGAVRLLNGIPMTLQGRIINLLELQQIDLTNTIMEDQDENKFELITDEMLMIEKIIETLTYCYDRVESESLQAKIKVKIGKFVDML